MKISKRVLDVAGATAILVVIFLIANSRLVVTKQSNTEARIRLVKTLFADCKKIDGQNFDRIRCVYEYGRRNGFPEERRVSWSVDGYGRPLVLTPSATCTAGRSCSVYSIGKNGIDECGRGDDITYGGCD